MQNQEDRIYTPSIVQKSNEDREIYAAAAADFRESRRLEKRVFVIVYSRRSFVVNLAMNYWNAVKLLLQTTNSLRHFYPQWIRRLVNYSFVLDLSLPV